MPIGENTIVFDVGSTKTPICEAVANHPKGEIFLLVTSYCRNRIFRPSAANRGLFQGKTNIICEVEKTTFKLQEKAVQLFTSHWE